MSSPPAHDSLLSLHDALPISFTPPMACTVSTIDEPAPGRLMCCTLDVSRVVDAGTRYGTVSRPVPNRKLCTSTNLDTSNVQRSEEHKSELQSQFKLVFVLLLE